MAQAPWRKSACLPQPHWQCSEWIYDNVYPRKHWLSNYFFIGVFCTVPWWRCAGEGDINMPLSLSWLWGPLVAPGQACSSFRPHNVESAIYFTSFSRTFHLRSFLEPLTHLHYLNYPHLYFLNIHFPLAAAFLLPVSYFCLSSSCPISMFAFPLPSQLILISSS